MSRVEDRLAAADPAAGLQPDPHDVHERAAALTAARPPRPPLALRLAPLAAVAALLVIAAVVAVGGPSGERPAAADPEPFAVYLRLDAEWPDQPVWQVWRRLDGSAERNRFTYEDGMVLQHVRFGREFRSYKGRRLTERITVAPMRAPVTDLLALLADVPGAIRQGRLRDLGRREVRGRSLRRVAINPELPPAHPNARWTPGASVEVDPRSHRPVWFVQRDPRTGVHHRTAVLDWRVLPDTRETRRLLRGP